MTNRKKQKKIIRRIRLICGILWYFAVGSLVLLLVVVLGAKLQGKVPSILGYSFLRISSGSMEPEIPNGTYILVRQVSPEKIRPGDIITFYSSDPLILGVPNTHRVFEDPTLEDGVIYYRTKGDANVAPDESLANSDRLIGRYVCSLNSLSAVSQAMKPGILIGLIVAMQVLSFAMMALSLHTMKKRVGKYQEGKYVSQKK